jgi:hypothetical protein
MTLSRRSFTALNQYDTDTLGARVTESWCVQLDSSKIIEVLIRYDDAPFNKDTIPDSDCSVGHRPP